MAVPSCKSRGRTVAETINPCTTSTLMEVSFAYKPGCRPVFHETESPSGLGGQDVASGRVR